MHPASSIVLFTTLSGAGFGAIAWLGVAGALGLLPDDRALAIASGVVALAFAAAGLIASTFHLRHPERAWRALSQWRSSWLSREGVLALLTMPAALGFVAAWAWCGTASWPAIGLGLIAAVGAIATVVATAMIYRSLWTVPLWHGPWTVPGFLLLALASGGLLLCAVAAISGLPLAALTWLPGGTLVFLLGAAAVKAWAWTSGGRAHPASDTAGAVGLGGRVTAVRPLEAPHTGETWLTREMVFRLGRRHARVLRRIAGLLALAFALPALLLACWMTGTAAAVFALLAAFAGLTAVLVERWLFFAEARHKVALYYGTDRV